MKSIDAYVISNIGNVRENHEDNFFVSKNNYINENKQKEIKSSSMNIEFEYKGDNGIFAVCDGMGGHNAGEVASRLAVKKILEKYDTLITEDKNVLLDFIKNLNNYICDYSNKNPECNNMGSTFSSLIINNKISILHIGDSKIYKIENNKIVQISKDHNEGNRLVDAGILKKENLMNFPNRKLLYKYLGRKGELVADCEILDIPNETSRFIIASDGLSDSLSNVEIEDVIAKYNLPKDVCQNLIKKSLEKGNGCSDNVTIICIDIIK